MLHFGRLYEGRVYPRRRRQCSLPWPQCRMQKWQHHDRVEQHEQHRAYTLYKCSGIGDIEGGSLEHRRRLLGAQWAGLP